MTSLSGDFQTDLALPDALAASLTPSTFGWRIESLEGKRIVSYATDSTQHSPKIEIALDDSGADTEVRIIGSDTDADPPTEQKPIAELNRARDAVEASVEQAVEASEIASEAQDDPEHEPAVATSRDPIGDEVGGPNSASISSGDSHWVRRCWRIGGAIRRACHLVLHPTRLWHCGCGIGNSGCDHSWEVTMVGNRRRGRERRQRRCRADGYNQYQDVQDRLDQAQQQLNKILSP